MDVIELTHKDRYHLYHTLLSDFSSHYNRSDKTQWAEMCLFLFPNTHPSPLPPLRSAVWKQLQNCKALVTSYQKLHQTISKENFLQHRKNDHNLRWFEPLQNQIACFVPEADLQPLIDNLKQKGHPDFLNVEFSEALVKLHNAIPIYDRRITQKWVQSFKKHVQEYEIDIARHIINTNPEYSESECKQHFLAWKKQGLYFPLLIASKYSNGDEDWTVVDKKAGQDPVLGLFLQTLQSFNVSHLQQLVSAWNRNKSSPQTLQLATELDHLAMVMRVKSDGTSSCFDLDRALGMFPVFDKEEPNHHTAFRIWHSLKQAISHVLPPSLFLRLNIMCGSQSTWGYEHLALHLDLTNPKKPVLLFKPQSLVWLQGNSNDSSRGSKLGALLSKIGEKLQHPAFATAVIHPLLSTRALLQTADVIPFAKEDIDKHIDNYHFANSLVTEMTMDSLPICDVFDGYWKSISQHIPTTQLFKLSRPLRLLLWRLDIPQRGIVTLDTQKTLPVARKKVLLKHKNSTLESTICQAHALTTPMEIQNIQQCLHEYVHQYGLDCPQFYNTKDNQRILNTNVIEAMHALAFDSLDQSKITTLIAGTKTVPWEHSEGIDARYAEIQTHPLTGEIHRYRDWVALYTDHTQTLQARLASHQFVFDQMYHICLPWVQEGPETKWVQLLSTSPFPFQILRGVSLKNNLDELFFNKPNIDKKDSEIYPVSKTEMHAVYTCTNQEQAQCHWAACRVVG